MRSYTKEERHQSTQAKPTSPIFGAAHRISAPSTRGTASAMVWFKQSNSVVSIFVGNGVSVVPSGANAAVSLYPSSVSATLLAR